MKQSSKWLVRTFIILGIGIPVVVELTTLMGLVGNTISNQATTEENKATEKSERIEPGSELLTETSQTELFKSAHVWVGQNSWEFSMTISISGLRNIRSMSFVLDSLETRNGNMVNESFTYDKNISHADSTYLFTANWNIPQGDQPKSVHLEATYKSPGDSVSESINKRLVFNKIPVQARK